MNPHKFPLAAGQPPPTGEHNCQEKDFQRPTADDVFALHTTNNGYMEDTHKTKKKNMSNTA